MHGTGMLNLGDLPKETALQEVSLLEGVPKSSEHLSLPLALLEMSQAQHHDDKRKIPD